MKKITLVCLFAFLGFSTITYGQSWQLLIHPSSYEVNNVSFSSTAYNRNLNIIYSVYKVGSTIKVYGFNLNTNSVSLISTSGQPSTEIGQFTFDNTNNRLIGVRAGRENLYAVSANGGSWSQIGSGSSDSESYGSSFYWNSSNQKIGLFGGYGFFATKNWIWENNGTWTNPYINNTNCNSTNPAKRTTQMALGNPGNSKLYFFSGQGSCTGNQSATSCSLGSPWATDVGVYCWLKDLWELDLTNYTFTNVLPVNSASITKEGSFTYDYINNTFYIVGGYVPSPTFNSNFGNTTNYETGLLRFRVGVDSGFSPLSVTGTPPPSTTLNNLGTNATYYDAINNQIVWARKDGIWAIKINSNECQSLVINSGSLNTNPQTYASTISIYPNPANDQITIDCGNLTNVQGWRIKINNMLGQEVFNQPMNTQQYVVPLNSWTGQGIYFVKIINSQNEVVNIKKIILQ